VICEDTKETFATYEARGVSLVVPIFFRLFVVKDSVEVAVLGVHVVSRYVQWYISD
jgi:hypothetical protein